MTEHEDHHRHLTESQQVKFNNYVEDKLMHISRRYVKHMSGSEGGYESISQLIGDLNPLIDVILYSIQSIPEGERLFGQEDYLLRISDELVEFIEGFGDHPEPACTLQVLSKLDIIFASLIDGNEVPQLSQTATVRLSSIVERTRVTVTNTFEGVDHDFQDGIAKIYEQVLDRTT